MIYSVPYCPKPRDPVVNSTNIVPARMELSIWKMDKVNNDGSKF